MNVIPLLIAIIASFAAVLLGIGTAFHYTVNPFFLKTPPSQSVRQGFPVAQLSSVVTVTPTPDLGIPPILSGEKGIKVPILLYHYISSNPNKDDKTRTGLSTIPSNFEAQLQLLTLQGYTTITLDELAATFGGGALLPSKPVILTFDDGYEDFYTNAYPLLSKYHMKGIAFIPTGLMGGGNYMTWRQIEEMSKSSYVVFGAHSIHHYALSKVNQQILEQEVTESKRILEQHVGYPINWMAYPYGSFNENVVGAAKKAGYIGSVTTIPGSMQYRSRFFYMPRFRAGNRLGADFLKLLQ